MAALPWARPAGGSPVAGRLVASLCLLSLLAACGDSAVRSSQEASRQIGEAIAALDKARGDHATAVASDEESYAARDAATLARLGQLANSLAAVPGDARDKAPALLLVAEIHSTSGSIAAARFERESAREREQRRRLAQFAAGAARLAAISSTLAASEPGSDRASLDRLRQTRVAASEALRREMDRARLDAATARRSAEETQRQAAAEFEQAEVARLEAMRSRGEDQRVLIEEVRGYLREATRLQTEAELDEFAAALRGLELATLERQASGEQIVAASADSAAAQSAAMSQAWRTEAQAVSSDLASLRELLASDLAAIALEEGAAEQVSRHFEQALLAAERAASSDPASAASARLMAASVLQQWGRFLLAAAARLDAEAEMLSTMVELREPADRTAALQSRLAAVSSQRNEMAEQARGRLAEAIERLEAISDSGDAAAAAMRNAALNNLAKLAGVERSLGNPSFEEEPQADAPRPAAAAGPPFASPQALIAGLAAIEAGIAPSVPMGSIMAASSAGGRQMLRASERFADAMKPIDDAMRDAFGPEASAAAALASAGGMGGAGGVGIITGWGSARVLDQDPAAATLSIGGQQVRLVSQNGSWFVDYEAIIAESGMDPGMLPMVAGMMEGMAQQMGTFFMMFAERVRDGEFASPEAAIAAMQQEMTSAMGGMGGMGGGGMRGGGGR